MYKGVAEFHNNKNIRCYVISLKRIDQRLGIISNCIHYRTFPLEKHEHWCQTPFNSQFTRNCIWNNVRTAYECCRQCNIRLQEFNGFCDFFFSFSVRSMGWKCRKHSHSCKWQKHRGGLQHIVKWIHRNGTIKVGANSVHSEGGGATESEREREKNHQNGQHKIGKWWW